MWEKHTQEYAAKVGHDPSRVRGILDRGGWEADKYTPDMKPQLFNWLDQWYTLSNKNIPQPATKARRNPDYGSSFYRRFTRLPNGWTILTEKTAKSFVTRATNSEVQHAKYNLDRIHADECHLEMVQKVMHDKN